MRWHRTLVELGTSEMAMPEQVLVYSIVFGGYRVSGRIIKYCQGQQVL